MSKTDKRDTAEMRYLLGVLSEDDTTRMENAIFADDSKFEAVALAEDELVDAYVRNELSPAEQQHFKARLVNSPRLIERVNFARALAETADSFPVTDAEQSIEPAVSFDSAESNPRAGWLAGLFAQQPAFGTALAVCAALILVAGVVLVSRLRSESARLETERAAVQRQKEDSDKLAREQQARDAQLDAEKRARDQRAEDLKLPDDPRRADKLKETQTRQPALSNFATVFLTPGLLRSGGGVDEELTIKPGTTTARIQLALEKDEYPTYTATIKTADGVEIFRKNRLKPQKTGPFAQLLLSVPASLLTRDTYTVHVDGVTSTGQVENVNDYVFQVTAKSH